MCIAVCIPHVVSQHVKMVVTAWDDNADGIQVIYFYKMRESLECRFRHPTFLPDRTASPQNIG